MQPIERADACSLSAAIGWLELGNPREAAAELERLTATGRQHPEVLDVQWRIGAEQKDWNAALQFAKRLIELHPENPSGWLHQSFSLHELERTAEAYQQLLKVADKFPKISTVTYNLACYACQLGQHYEAFRWLERTVQLLGQDQVRRMALKDPDLQPLWKEIEAW